MIRQDIPRVALLVHTSTGWGRRLARGVIHYASQHGPWDLWLEPRGQNESLRLPAGWQGDGVIARIADRATADHLRSFGKVVVNVSAISITGTQFPRVTTDIGAEVELALQHFLDRGIRNFGYVGLPRRGYSIALQKAFVEACAEVSCESIPFNPNLRGGGKTSWEGQRGALAEWLASLPKPVGIFTWGVQRGLEVIATARIAGLRVPDEVAVLGGDEDELLCEAVWPSLSGIKTDADQIGHIGAALLDRLIRGETVSEKALYVEPTGVAARGSTDVLALDDPDVIAAVRFIRDHADQAIRVNDVAHAMAMSRRSLERRFLRAFDRTIAEEIARVHMQRAKMLLAESDLPIPNVAEAAGFGSPEYLATVFRREFGVTPLKYRAQVRGR